MFNSDPPVVCECVEAEKTASLVGMVFVTFQYRHDAENALKAVNCLELLDKPVGNTWAHYITIKSIVKDIDNHAIHNVFLRFGNVLSLEVVNDMIELTENNEAKMKFMRFANTV